MGKRFAICVGIDDYIGFENLSFCSKDAEEISQMFIEFCNVDKDCCTIITSSLFRPQSNPWQSLEETVKYFQTSFLPNEDDIFFYFSGHGIKADNTTVVFKRENHSIPEILSLFQPLKPKNQIFIFDSCHSGAGFDEMTKSAMEFNELTKLSEGYAILAACARYQTAKESRKLQNGKFTRYLIDIIADKESYGSTKYIDINSLFSKINENFFGTGNKDQIPFIQIKASGSYPLANQFNEEILYKKYHASKEDSFDWPKVLTSLKTYLAIGDEMLGEFISFIREHVSNTLDPLKGGAQSQIIEITKNKVNLIDDGNYFDLFDPPKTSNRRGGIETAEYFKAQYADDYIYSTVGDPGLNQYLFVFTKNDTPCQLLIDFHEIDYLRIADISIPEECNSYTIRFKKYSIIISLSYIFVEKFLNTAIKYSKKIIIEIPSGNTQLIKHFNEAIKIYDAGSYLTVSIY